MLISQRVLEIHDTSFRYTELLTRGLVTVDAEHQVNVIVPGQLKM